ncbi:MAG: asparagine synthase (glutamine-hydrolyzing) [Flavisolibacter sp.]
MCGISGFFSAKNKLDKEDLLQMTSCLKHRGPDAGGLFISEDEQTGLGHRRLSILDLSDAANQPMYSSCGRYVIVFNGEVYNFREIATSIKRQDPSLQLHTTSDTEVVLQAFIQNGSSLFSELNGMFAFAIYDKEQRKITLCRDHIGIKPLFYYWDGESFVFASELKALAALKQLKKEVNEQAISQFLHLGYIPEPLTIYRNVYKFPSGHFLEIGPHDVSFQIKPFWKVEDKIEAGVLKDERQAKDELRKLLFDAVEKQLVSDVPIGTFLSGGIDSSVVTAIASKVSPGKVKTFNIGFEENLFDESVYAASVAKHLNTEHYTSKVKEKDILELVPELLNVYDEPFADSSAFPTMLVSKLARQHVTVALSGDGGDELFLGYGMYTWAKRLNNPLARLFRKPLKSGLSLMNERYKRVAGVLDYSGRTHLKSHIFSQEQKFFSERELARLLCMEEKPDYAGLNKIFDAVRSLNAYEQQSFWDLTHYLKDDLLVKVDRASMKYSLESRVPLLDFRVVEFALNLDTSLKKRQGVSKYLLKEILYELVPRAIFDRPKRGFAIPLHKWLKGELRFLMDKYTSREIIETYAIVNHQQVASLKKRYLSGENYLYNRLWAIILLHWWLEEKN